MRSFTCRPSPNEMTAATAVKLLPHHTILRQDSQLRAVLASEFVCAYSRVRLPKISLYGGVYKRGAQLQYIPKLDHLPIHAHADTQALIHTRIMYTLSAILF